MRTVRGPRWCTPRRANPHKIHGYLHDPHGNVPLLLSASGPVEASSGYSAYGSADATWSKGDTSADNPLNPYRYTGHRYDTGSGTPDMGARWYLRQSGRFLQRDEHKLLCADRWLTTDALNYNRYALAAGIPVT